MKKMTKYILGMSGSLIAGVLIGGSLLYYFIDDLPARFMVHNAENYTTYNVMMNTIILQEIRNNNLRQAIEYLEFDLDTNIISSHGLLQDQEFLSSKTKENMRSKLKTAKKYRLKHPRASKHIEIDKKVNDILSQIKID